MAKYSRDSLISGAFFQYLSQIIFLSSGLFFYAVMMHSFSTSFVGDLVLISTLVQIISSVFSFPLQNAFMHFLSYDIGDDNDPMKLSQTFMKLVIVLSICSGVFLYFSSSFFSSLFFHSQAETGLVRFSSVYLTLSVFSGLLTSIYYGIQRFRYVSLVKTLSYIAGYGLAVIMGLYSNSVVEVIIGLTIGQVIIVSLLIAKDPSICKIHWRSKSKVNSKVIMAYSTPLILSLFIGTSAGHVDKLITASLMSVASVGIYNLSLLIAAGLFGIFQSINQIVVPKLSEIYARGDISELKELINKSTILLGNIFIPVTLSVIAISKQLSYIAGGVNYAGSVVPLQLILMLMALSAPIIVLSMLPDAIRKTKINYITAPLSLITNVSLSLVLIPIYGLIGAAIGYSVLYPLRLIVIYVASRKWVSLRLNVRPLVKIWLFSGTTSLFMWYIGRLGNFTPLSLLYVVPIALFIYVMLIRFFNFISNEDIKLIIQYIPKNFKRVRTTIIKLTSVEM